MYSNIYVLKSKLGLDVSMTQGQVTLEMSMTWVQVTLKHQQLTVRLL